LDASEEFSIFANMVGKKSGRALQLEEGMLIHPYQDRAALEFYANMKQKLTVPS
jgi:hypothetical protein